MTNSPPLKIQQLDLQSRLSAIEQTDPGHIMLSPFFETFQFSLQILCSYGASMTAYPVSAIFYMSRKGVIH